MTYQRLAYAEADPTAVMRRDCGLATEQMRLDPASAGRAVPLTVAERVAAPAPSILFSDLDREIPKPEIRVSDAAVRLAAALHLHLD